MQRYSCELVLLLTLVVRLPGVTRPLLGNFSVRNAVHAMGARNWVRGESPWWLPTLDVLTADQPAWHLVEVPISAYLSGALWRLCGGSLDAWGRLTSIGWSMLAVALIHGIVRRHCGHSAALAAALTVALSPVSITYGQGFMLEPSVMALLLSAWTTTERYLDGGQRRWLPLLSVVLAVLWLSKVYALLIVPLIAWQCWGARRRRSAVDLAWLAAAVALAAIPCGWWLFTIWQLSAPDAPTAGHVYYSLRHSTDAHGFPHPLLANPEFYWRMVADWWTVTLTPVGTCLSLIGLRHVAWRRWWPLLALATLLVVAMPRKFYEMNYYQLLLLPFWAGIVGLGWRSVGGWVVKRRRIAWSMLALTLVCSLRYSLRPAFMTPAEDRSVVAAAEAVRDVSRTDDRIVTVHGTSLDLLYYCDRRGWMLPLDASDFAARLAHYRRSGAQWLAIAGMAPLVLPSTVEAALATFPVEASREGFRVYRLADVIASDRSASSTRIPNAPGTR